VGDGALNGRYTLSLDARLTLVAAQVYYLTGEITGTIKTLVHYYEDGNVQLNSERKVWTCYILLE